MISKGGGFVLELTVMIPLFFNFVKSVQDIIVGCTGVSLFRNPPGNRQPSRVRWQVCAMRTMCFKRVVIGDRMVESEFAFRVRS